MKIVFLTETRADWGGLRPVVVEAAARGHEVVVHTPYPWVPPVPEGIAVEKRASRAFPGANWLVVLGDRKGVLFPVIHAYSAGNVGIAHLSGGDRQDGHLLDEPVRHAISKFAHLHFPGSEASAQRLIRHGEETNRICKVGSTMVDDLLQFKPVRKLDFGKIFVVLHHPAPGWIEELESIRKVFFPAWILEPNNDSWHGKLTTDLFQSLSYNKHMDRKAFLQLIWNSRAFVGNSSSMWLEAQYLGIPCVAIGERNRNRQEAFPGHIVREYLEDYGDHDHRTDRGLRADYARGAFGEGNAAWKILDTLEGIGVPDKEFLRKIWE